MSKLLTFTKNDQIILYVIILLGMICFGVSLFSPIMTISTALVFSKTYTLAGGIAELFHHGDWLLMFIVLVFSVLIPFGKFLILFRIISCRHPDHASKKLLQLMHTYSRWSMFDVFLVAVLVSSVKIGQLANVEMEYGVYLFVGAIFLTMYVTARLTRRLEAIDK